MNGSPLHPPGGPPETTGSRWEDLLDIFYAPARVFERRRDGRFAVPLVVLVVAFVVLLLAHFQVLGPVYEAQFDEMIMDLEDQGVAASGMRTMLPWITVIGGLVTFPIGVVVMALVVWVLGRVLGSAAGFSLAMVVATFSHYPRLGGYLVESVQGMLIDATVLDSLHRLAIGPVRFLDPEVTGPALFALATRFDLFTLWVTALVAVGMHVTMRVTAGRAIAGAAILWMLATAVALMQTIGGA